MYQWNLNGHSAKPERWNRWAIGLLGGSIGALLMGALWWRQHSAQSTPQQLRSRDLRRLGQLPARSHIQLFSHPARQEQPR